VALHLELVQTDLEFVAFVSFKMVILNMKILLGNSIEIKIILLSFVL